MLENEYKSYTTIKHDNSTIGKNLYACIGKIKKIGSTISTEYILNLQLRITNVHGGYTTQAGLKQGEYTTLNISHICNNGNADDDKNYTISYDNISNFDVKAFDDGEYIHIYVKGNIEYYNGCLKIDTQYINNAQRWYPNAFAKFVELPNALTDLKVELSDSYNNSTRTLHATDYKKFIRMLDLKKDSNETYSFMLVVHGNSNDGAGIEKYKIVCAYGTFKIELLEKDKTTIIDGYNTRTNFITSTDGKHVYVFIRNFGYNTRATYDIINCINVKPYSNVTPLNENDGENKPLATTSEGEGDLKEDGKTESTLKKGCFYTKDRMK